MELRQVRYFLVVAEELHFGRAAERLHIVQSSVSEQIRRLERELGVELFTRSTRTVRLSPAGAAFLPHARAVTAAEAAAREAVREHRAVAGRPRLRLGTNVGLGTRLDELLTHLTALTPELTVDLVDLPAAARLARVRDGALDAALVRGAPEGQDGLELLPAWDDELVAVLPPDHPLAAAPQVALADLAALPLRLSARDANPYLYDLVHDACRAAGFAPLPGPPFPHGPYALTQIATGVGGPAWTVHYAAHQPTSRVAFRPFAPPHRPVAHTQLALRAGPPAPPVTTLLTAVAAVAATAAKAP